MSEMRTLLVDTASRLCTDLCERKAVEDAEMGIWPEALWNGLEAAGLTQAATSEERGGAGADVSDVMALLGVIGRFAVPLPLAETLIAEKMLAAAGLDGMAGPLTIGPVVRGDSLVLRQIDGGWELSGTLHRIPWGAQAKAIVVLAEYGNTTRTVLVEHPPVGAKDWNYAREPRDTLVFENFRIAAEAVGPGAIGFTVDELFFHGALFRSVMMAGALERVLESTVGYAKERVQFGRTISKFQAVQQQIAVLASEVAAASAAAQGAVDAAQQYSGHFEIAAAKARVGEAAGIAASIAHQVHGAMGFTHEHSLHRSTRRLWSWRDEFGAEFEWAAWVGNAVAKVGGENLWSFLTAPSKTQEAG